MTVKSLLKATFLSFPLTLLLILAACNGGSENNPESFKNPTATSRPNDSQIVIEYPPDGAVIYAETLYISGQVFDNAQQFRLELINTEDETIAQTTVDTQPGEWQVNLTHGYSGDPTEITIRAVPIDGNESLYDTAAILLTDMSHRPDSVYGTILTPSNGSEAGGDVILVAGRASGVFENELIVEFIGDADHVIDSQVVLLTNPYFVDEIPWEIALNTHEYTGQARINIFATNPDDKSRIELDSVLVTITEVAG